MSEARPSAWLGAQPGEGVYLGVGEIGRRFRKVEDLNRTIRCLESIIEAKRDDWDVIMPETMIKASEGRYHIIIYGVISEGFDEKHARSLLNQLQRLQQMARSPEGREALGFEAIRWPRRSSRNTTTSTPRSDATSAAGTWRLSTTATAP